MVSLDFLFNKKQDDRCQGNALNFRLGKLCGYGDDLRMALSDPDWNTVGAETAEIIGGNQIEILLPL